MKKHILSLITILVGIVISISASAQAPQKGGKFVIPKNRAELLARRNLYQQQEKVAEASRRRIMEEQARAAAHQDKQVVPVPADRPKQ